MKQRKKIILIGPIYPYKGGISHYTSLMCRTLKKEHDVYMLSFKMQYPKILYRREQKDYEDDTFRVDGTDYAIQTANPFNWFGVASKIRKINPDLVIIQWWHPYFAPCYFTIRKLIGRIRVMFICHNVFPHERFPMDKFLTKMTLAGGNYFIVQSSQDENNLKSIKPQARYKKTVHPAYNTFKWQNMSKERGRELLQIKEEERVLLFFGFVREYKGLRHLLKAMPEVLAKLDGVRLLVVGDFDGNKEEYLRMIHDWDIAGAVDIYDGYIPDKEVEKFFAAADLVVLPYESATQSGIVQIAYGFEKPVIATDVGGLPEVVIDGTTGYVVHQGDTLALADSIVKYFTEDRENDFIRGIREEAYKYSWDRMAQVIRELALQ
ncbi:MAG: glycosyltransferase family 4 protein [Roseburia sp.]|nr:glycosyltransferase family 4 protein [Roseburia sp.]